MIVESFYSHGSVIVFTINDTTIIILVEWVVDELFIRQSSSILEERAALMND